VSSPPLDPVLDLDPHAPVLATEAQTVEAPGDEATISQIRALPREMGVMLVAVGSLGWLLPGMVGTPALIAGGLVLWPRAFGKVESWFERRYPKLHHESMRQLGRYLRDLDRRYPESALPPASDPQ
jgi:hypothetical protein